MVVPNISIKEPNNFIKITPRQIRAMRSCNAGVYFLLNRFGEIVYIGQSTNLRRRLSEHVNGGGRSSAFAAHIDSIRIYPFPNGFEREIYETYFIDRHKPFYNIAKKHDRGELSEKESAIFNEYHRLHDVLIRLDDEEYRIREDFAPMDDEESDDYYYDEDTKNTYELGVHLRGVGRLREVRAKKRRVLSEIKTIRRKMW